MNDHVVIVPSWPLEAGALVMTLDLKDGMKESGKFLFSDQVTAKFVELRIVEVSLTQSHRFRENKTASMKTGTTLNCE